MRAAEKEKEKLEIQLLAESRLASYNEKEKEREREREKERQKELYFKSAMVGEITNPVDASSMVVVIEADGDDDLKSSRRKSRSPSTSPHRGRALSTSRSIKATARSQSSAYSATTARTDATGTTSLQTDVAVCEDVIQPVKKMSVYMPASPIRSRSGKKDTPLVARSLSPQNVTAEMVGVEFGYDIHKGVLLDDNPGEPYRRTQSAASGTYRHTQSPVTSPGAEGQHQQQHQHRRPMTMQEKRNVALGHTPSYQYHQMARTHRHPSTKPRALSPLPIAKHPLHAQEQAQ